MIRKHFSANSSRRNDMHFCVSLHDNYLTDAIAVIIVIVLFQPIFPNYVKLCSGYGTVWHFNASRVLL